MGTKIANNKYSPVLQVKIASIIQFFIQMLLPLAQHYYNSSGKTLIQVALMSAAHFTMLLACEHQCSQTLLVN